MSKADPKRLTDLGIRADAVKIDPRIVKIKDNVRNFDLPENKESLIDLAKSIAKFGVQTPIIVEYDDGECILFDGERRLRATWMAIDQLGAQIETIMAFQKIGKASTPAERIAGQIMFNSSKHLSHLELGPAYQQLINWGWSLDKIAEHTSYSIPHIQSILKLAEAPEEIKTLVANNGTADTSISASLAEGQLKTRGAKGATQVIKAAKKVAEKAGSSRITARHIAEVTGEQTPRAMNEEAREIINSLKEILVHITETQDVRKVHLLAKSALQDHFGYEESDAA